MRKPATRRRRCSFCESGGRRTLRTNWDRGPILVQRFSSAGVIAPRLWWRPSPSAARHLPVERFFGAMRAGFRHARNNPQLMATLIRAVAFFLIASAYWALLPLVTRDQVAGGPDLYGYLLGTIGAAAVGLLSLCRG